MQAAGASRPQTGDDDEPWLMIDDDPNSVRRECRHNKYVHFYRNVKGIVETDEKKPVKLAGFRGHGDEDSKGGGGPSTSKGQSGDPTGSGTEDSGGIAAPVSLRILAITSLGFLEFESQNNNVCTRSFFRLILKMQSPKQTLLYTFIGMAWNL